MATALGSFAPDTIDAERTDWEALTVTTHCGRCGGLMVSEPCIDFSIRRCVQCGEVIDPIILKNRRQISATT